MYLCLCMYTGDGDAIINTVQSKYLIFIKCCRAIKKIKDFKLDAL